MKRTRRFCIRDDEILQCLNASASEDDENQFDLDDEDMSFLENDIKDLDSDIEIEIEDVLSSEKPSTSKSTGAQVSKNRVPLKSATPVCNSYIVYDKLSTNSSSPFSISLLEFRSQLATQMINSFSSRKYETSSTPRAGSKRARLTTNNFPLSGHYLTRMDSGVRKRCVLCTKNGIDNRTNSICFTCDKPFCYTKERNCFEIHHK